MSEKKTVNGLNVEQLFSSIETFIEKTGNRPISNFAPPINGLTARTIVPPSGNFSGRARKIRPGNPRFSIWMNLRSSWEIIRGLNPVEYLLVALSGCLTTAMVAHASAQGIDIEVVESRYEGDIDLRGFLGLSPEVKVGFEEIRVYFKIEADISEAQKEELVRMAQEILTGIQHHCQS